MRYPIKTSTKEVCDTIARSLARYEKYRCWASKPCPAPHFPGKKGKTLNKQRVPCKSGVRQKGSFVKTRSTTTRDFGAPSPLDFLNFLHAVGFFLVSSGFQCNLERKSPPKCGENCPIPGRRKKSRILPRLWLSWFFDPDFGKLSRWERKGRFRKRVGGFGERALVPIFVPGEHANVSSSRFSFRGNMRMYPRSGFRSGGTPAKTTLLETTLLSTPAKGLSGKSIFWIF